MKPRLSFNLSRGARLAALAVVAVLLPIVILSFIQYRSLIDIQAKTKVAVQENLRQTLQSVSMRVSERLNGLARETLGTLDLPAAGQGGLDRMASQLAGMKQAHPEIDQLFVVMNCSCQKGNFALFDTRSGVRRFEDAQVENSAEVQRATEAFKSAHTPYPSVEKHPDFLFERVTWAVSRGEVRGPFEVAIFSHLNQQGGIGQRGPGFAGLMVNSDFIRTQLLPQIMAELLRGSDPGVKDPALAVGVFDEYGREIYPGGSNHYEIKREFGPVYSKWELGAGYQGTTIEALAKDQFKKSLILTGLVLSLLILGLILTLRAATREMRLAQAKTTFVSNVSHELKTPLALIRLFAETLELDRVKSQEKAHEYYRIIHHESRRLTQLINNILDFSKIEAGRREYQFADADVSEVVREVLDSYEYQLKSAGFELKTDIPPHLPSASIDRDAIAQAFLNLLNNAVKYSAEKKEITVRACAREGQIAIEVADCGIGIPRSEHEKIFEKFYRVSTGLIHDTKGSGLGLALVKHIAEAHGGCVTVGSAPGQGSWFTILIPISQTTAQPSPTPEAGGYRVAENPHH